MVAAWGQAALPVSGHSKGNWKVGRAVLSAPEEENKGFAVAWGQAVLPFCPFGGRRLTDARRIFIAKALGQAALPLFL